MNSSVPTNSLGSTTHFWLEFVAIVGPIYLFILGDRPFRSNSSNKPFKVN